MRMRTLKATFGLGILAALAVTAFSAVGASATTSGHFTSSVANPILTGTEVTGSSHEMSLAVLGESVSCHEPSYSGTLAGTTTQTITVNAQYSKCTTGSGEPATVTMNGCAFVFTSRSVPHATTHFECPVGKKAEVHTPNCTIEFGAQTTGGTAFHNIVGGEITVTSTTTKIVNERHGLCFFVGGTGPVADASLTGSVTVKGSGGAHLTAT